MIQLEFDLEKPSIYEIIKSSYSEECVDEQKVYRTLKKLGLYEEFEVKYERLYGNFTDDEMDEYEERKIKKLVLFIEEVGKGLDFNEADEILKKLDLFNIEKCELIKRLGYIIYNNNNIYDYFKRFIYKTRDVDILKVALLVTGLDSKCEEFLSDYYLFGQIELFSYQVSIITRWVERNEFKILFFSLLDVTSGECALDFTFAILKCDEFIKCIDNQEEIIRKAFNKKVDMRRINWMLVRKFDFETILQKKNIDIELASFIIKIFKSLTHDYEEYVGLGIFIVDFQVLLKLYFSFLKNLECRLLRYYGVSYLSKFLDTKVDGLTGKEELHADGLYDLVEDIEIIRRDIWEEADENLCFRKIMGVL